MRGVVAALLRLFGEAYRLDSEIFRAEFVDTRASALSSIRQLVTFLAYNLAFCILYSFSFLFSWIVHSILV